MEHVSGKERIMVLGVGSAGNHMIDRMMKEELDNVRLVSANTDRTHLECYEAHERFLIGRELTMGNSAGSDPGVGASAAEESREELKQLLEAVDWLILVCGLGGGTGTGATPLIGQIAKEMGIFTTALVTKPLTGLEKENRTKIADQGILQLQKSVDSLIIVSYDKLLQKVAPDHRISLPDFLREADKRITFCVDSLIQLVHGVGSVSIAFEDIKVVLGGNGIAYLGAGKGSGERKCLDAMEEAMNSPLLDVSLQDVSHIIISIVGDVGVEEVNNTVSQIEEEVSEDCDIIISDTIDETKADSVEVMIIAVKPEI